MTISCKTLHRLTLVLTYGLAVLSTQADAQQSLIVGNDRGGLVATRAREVDSIKRLGQRVEIRGTVCYSTCTMYLGASDVCVSPNTTFGFHGPSRSGAPLPTDQFERWSRLMASYYNQPLQQWFLQQGRYKINDVYRMSGSQLIALGYRTC
jgi:hypothetical protein